jgi:hypothetical protein
MFPNHSQNQPTTPVNLPVVPSDRAQQGVVSATPVLATGDVVSHNIAQAKQLVLKYGSDPSRLSEALNQLKVAYLADRYHITVNQADD